MVMSSMHTIAIDIGVMMNFKWSQGGTRAIYFLLACDVFSQYIWLQKLVSKGNKHVIPALRTMLKSMHPSPTYLWGDRESAFLSHEAKALFKEYGCKFYSTTSAQTKSVYAEIGIRKVKSKLYMHMTSTGNKNWVNILDQVAKGLNNTRLPALAGLTPIQARKPENHDKIFHHKFHRIIVAPTPLQNLRFEIGSGFQEKKSVLARKIICKIGLMKFFK